MRLILPIKCYRILIQMSNRTLGQQILFPIRKHQLFLDLPDCVVRKESAPPPLKRNWDLWVELHLIAQFVNTYPLAATG